MAAQMRCAIVGGGVSALASARWARDYAYLPVLLERTDQLGGLWNYRRERQDIEIASVAQSTVQNTAKEMTAYSDFPPPDHFANYMHHKQMHEYLELYAKHHGLNQYIQYNSNVVDVRRAPDYARNGRWRLKWRHGDHGAEAEDEFDAVLLAQGHHAKPKTVRFPGQEHFEGRIIHSHDYKDSRGFEDAVNVVVGVGNSGLDIGVELSYVSRKCFQSTRRGAWIGKRVGPRGIPEDCVFNSRFHSCVWNRFVPEWIRNWLAVRNCQWRFDHAKYGIMPNHNYYAQPLAVCDDFPNRILSGALCVKPNIREFTRTGIVWEDGNCTEHVDNVVMATGYMFDFEIVEHGELIPVRDNDTRLYLYMFPPQLTDWNTLGIIGLAQPTGAIPPLSELQARLFFAARAGEIKLPSRELMEWDIGATQAVLDKKYADSTRQTLTVDYVLYMDKLADLLGCKPNPWRYALRNPRLAHTLMFGPNASYAYRLHGSHPWAGAEAALLDMQRRMEVCLTGRKVEKKPHPKETIMLA